MISATAALSAIISDMVKVGLKGSIPTTAEIIPPIPIWIHPSNAEAVPAFLENGARASAAAFG